jgi:hypothetical protein
VANDLRAIGSPQMFEDTEVNHPQGLLNGSRKVGMRKQIRALKKDNRIGDSRDIRKPLELVNNFF